MFLRKFIEAVLLYTGATKVDVISHSMGVSFTRRVLKGGIIYSLGESFDLGQPLTEKVDTFVGIAGPNWGISNCALYVYSAFKVCNN